MLAVGTGDDLSGHPHQNIFGGREAIKLRFWHLKGQKRMFCRKCSSEFNLTLFSLCSLDIIRLKMFPASS